MINVNISNLNQYPAPAGHLEVVHKPWLVKASLTKLVSSQFVAFNRALQLTKWSQTVRQGTEGRRGRQKEIVKERRKQTVRVPVQICLPFALPKTLDVQPRGREQTVAAVSWLPHAIFWGTFDTSWNCNSICVCSQKITVLCEAINEEIMLLRTFSFP